MLLEETQAESWPCSNRSFVATKFPDGSCFVVVESVSRSAWIWFGVKAQKSAGMSQRFKVNENPNPLVAGQDVGVLKVSRSQVVRLAKTAK